jgi:hypothetical protein
VSADFDLLLRRDDGCHRVVDQLTAFRLLLLEVFGLSEDDDPGDGEGWLEAIGEKVLGCPIDEAGERGDELLEQIDRIYRFFKGGLDDASELMKIEEQVAGAKTGQSIAKAISAPSKVNGSRSPPGRGGSSSFAAGPQPSSRPTTGLPRFRCGRLGRVSIRRAGSGCGRARALHATGRTTQNLT